VKLSAVSSVFVNYFINDAASFIAQAGCRGIDVWGGRPHVYRSDYSQEQLKALRQQLDDNNLKVVSFMPAFFRYPHSLSTPNEIVRQDSIDYMRACLDNAVTLGADTLLIVPGRSLYNQSVDEARQRLIESIDTVCQAAAEYPIKLGIEPANLAVSDLVITSDDALHIINTLKHDNLGVVLDTGHIHLNKERLEDALQKLGKRLLQFHINDNDGKHQQNQIPGDGTFDFEQGMSTLAASGFDGYLSIELGWEYTTDPFPAVQESVKRMRVILDKV
jgi:protein FrlC